jgi:hypothetical protein
MPADKEKKCKMQNVQCKMLIACRILHFAFLILHFAFNTLTLFSLCCVVNNYTLAITTAAAWPVVL